MPADELLGQRCHHFQDHTHTHTYTHTYIYAHACMNKPLSMLLTDVVISFQRIHTYNYTYIQLADKLLGMPQTDVVITFQSAEGGQEYTVVLTRGLNASSQR